MLSDTIVAISTPPGRGGIGIVRLSGTRAREISETFIKSPPGEWRSWSAHLGQLVDDAGQLVDRVVVTYYAAPKSYTAEDVIDKKAVAGVEPAATRRRAGRSTTLSYSAAIRWAMRWAQKRCWRT